MSSNKSIREDTILSTITKAIGTPGDYLDKIAFKSSRNYGKYGSKTPSNVYLKGSISNYANDLIMVFPMLCDDSLPPETISMIARANERNIVAMLEMLFASAQFNAVDGTDVIGSIYKKPNMAIDDYIDSVNNYVANSEATVDLTKIEEGLVLKEMVNELKKPKKVYSCDAISEKSLSDYSVKMEYGSISSVLEAGKRNPNNNPPGLDGRDFDADGNPLGSVEFKPKADESLDNQYKQAQINNIKSQLNDRDLKHLRDVAADKRQNFLDRRQIAMDKERLARDMQIRQQDIERDARLRNQDIYRDAIQKRLLDIDVKKANELQPTLMVINYNEIDPENGSKIYGVKTFVAGVKSRVIPTDPRDIIDRITAKNRTRINFLNLIRATTGEIHLVRDFLLCIDQAKIDARNAVKKGEAANMWKTLEFMSAKNNYNRIRRKGNDASAITTLVISRETANLLKKQYNFDIDNERNANKVIEDYNLLGIFIVDESVEVVKSLYRGNRMYEQDAFSFLERESNDKSYKKVINLMGQMNRGY